MVWADFLRKHLSIHWRDGTARLAQPLVDGGFANNTGNWPWVAGAGTDTRLSPERQARRSDPDGALARRHVPEFGTADHQLPLA
jgi:deoxyribodipyrimidine photo-lyase